MFCFAIICDHEINVSIILSCVGATKNMNWRYLATPVKRLNAERRRRQLLSRQRRIKKLEDHITRLVEGSKSQLQDEEVHEEIVNIIEEHDHQINQLGQDDIKRIFWNQQVYYLIVMSMKQ